MAEQVQATLDQMVAPLQDLQERKIFSPEEIHAIVDRRRTSEYLLRRRQVRKNDYLRYIQDEVNLEKLRQLRTKRLQSQEKHDNRRRGEASAVAAAKHIGDKHCLQHIHSLWTRTLRKFRSDPALYLQYADFLKEIQAHRKLSQLYASALQIFPKESGWWIEAASHEYFGSSSSSTGSGSMGSASSVSNARILLQRGLRMNPTARDLWLQSFCLELHFATKLLGRRQILLLGHDEKQNGNDEGDKKGEDAADIYRIARLVHDNAIQAVDNDVAFRMQFLEQCNLFPAVQTLRQHILQRLQEDCCHDQPQAWIAAAQCHLLHCSREQEGETRAGFLKHDEYGEQDKADDDNEDSGSPPQKKKRRTESRDHGPTTEDPVLSIMREATRKIPTQAMYLEAIRFLVNYRDNHLSKPDDDDDGNTKMQHACNRLLNTLLQEASDLKDYSVALLLEHVDFLVQGNKYQAAISRLERFANNGCTEATVWTRWASLVFQQTNKTHKHNAIDILTRALTVIPMGDTNHVPVLLQLFGAKLALQQNLKGRVEDAWSVFDRIVLLAPGWVEQDDIKDPAFGVKSVADACLQFLLHVISSNDLKAIRRVYQKVLFQSSLTGSMSGSDTAAYRAFVDASIEAEKNYSPESTIDKRERLLRLFDAAIMIFGSTVYGVTYRQRRDDEALYGSHFYTKQPVSDLLTVPTLDASSSAFTTTTMMSMFKKYQIVHLKNVGRSLSATHRLNWRDIGKLFHDLIRADRESWCIERDAEGQVNLSPQAFLRPFVTSDCAYCSFLVQKDHALYKKTLNRLPIKEFTGITLFHEKAIWFFFGRNPLGGDTLEGRPEHTDSVSHDGTWHYQLSGTKLWFVRPSSALLEYLQGQKVSYSDNQVIEDTRWNIECKEGDVILLNTRLWFHRTSIPPQPLPSLSYAQDFWLSPPSAEQGAGMTNVDGLYATEEIEPGTVIFTETEMPDCELARSSANPNCEVVELEDGTNAIISSRSIAAGEFFCVPESGDESSDGEH